MGRPPNETKSRTAKITINEEEYLWLVNNPQFSASGLLRWAIAYHKKIGTKIKEVDKNY